MSEHWYKANGEPCHTVPKKRGGGERPTNIRDARELGLFPSVTSILGILAKPQLDDWKHRQITAAALKLPPHLDESADSYHGRVMDAAFLQVEQAADAGTLIHEGAELALQGLEYDREKEIYLPQLDKTYALKTFIQPIERFIQNNEVQTTAHELRLVNTYDGYAGLTDVAMRAKPGFGILDYKTRKTKPGKPVTPYDGQAMQIAAYHVAHYHSIPAAGSHAIGCNLFISTTEPGRVEPCWYSPEQLEREWHAFAAALKLWRHLKNYDPRTSHPPIEPEFAD